MKGQVYIGQVGMQRFTTHSNITGRCRFPLKMQGGYDSGHP